MAVKRVTTNRGRQTPGVAGLASCKTASRDRGVVKGLSRVRGNCAPRDAGLNPCRRQERIGGRPLGHPIHLKAKAGGDKSMSEKREASEDAYEVVLQGPRDMVKATLPEPQSPAVPPAPSPPQRLGALLPGAPRSSVAGRTLGLAGDRERLDLRGCVGRLRRARYVQHHRNAGWPTGRESQGHGVLVVVGGGESPPRGEGGQVGGM